MYIFKKLDIFVINEIFRKNGTYSRYKDLLGYKGVLEKWYDFKNYQEQTALLQWYEENDIDLRG